MIEGVGDGFAQVAFGQDGPALGESVEELFEAAVNGAAARGAGGFAQDGAGVGFSEPALDLIEVGKLAKDPTDKARGLI